MPRRIGDGLILEEVITSRSLLRGAVFRFGAGLCRFLLYALPLNSLLVKKGLEAKAAGLGLPVPL
jgi:hypothetical protein